MYISDGAKSIQYGKEHEEDGIAFFEKFMGLKVYKCGIYMHKSGLLGATPDGLVSKNIIIEVKCPYSLRQYNDLKDGIKESKINSLDIFEDEIILKKRFRVVPSNSRPVIYKWCSNLLFSYL